MRIRGVQPIDVGQQDQTIGAGHLCDARRQPVIVAVTDFSRRHGIVFIDHRHAHRGITGYSAYRAR